jgi:hypothetical protein
MACVSGFPPRAAKLPIDTVSFRVISSLKGLGQRAQHTLFSQVV